MTARTPCPEPTVLKDLLAGSLAEPQATAVGAHLEDCISCQQVLEGFAAERAYWEKAAQKLAPNGKRAGIAPQRDAVGNGASEAQTLIKPGKAGDPELGFLSPSTDPTHLGRLGPYEVLQVIGRGGMGIVLKAFDPSLHRVVAVKVLAPQLATSATARRRFTREAQAAAAVSHDHVVGIHAVSEANGLPYLVMQYVAGQSLQEKLDSAGPLELKEILRIGMQTAAGLAAAHAQGLIHRDIKPANILLENGIQRVKITDFGLARAADDANLTQSGVVAGSPSYMAPEQARGERLDYRTDLFSLGSVLYAMCTGEPPFRADSTMGILCQVSEDMPQSLREINAQVPEWLVAVIDKLHAKDPGQRIQSAAEVAELLGERLAQLQQTGLASFTGNPRAGAAFHKAAPGAPPAPSPSPPASPSGLTPCAGCGRQISVHAFMCPNCGRPIYRGFEFRSKTTVFGWPLVHIATGINPLTGCAPVAKGIIAIGQVAIGVFALGGCAIGGIAIGGITLGLVSLGGLALGILLAMGGMSVGGVALGGMAVGLVAMGGGAAGYYAMGGGAWGVHPLGGGVRDPEALRFFADWLGTWVYQFGQ
jgi:serine/threonine-protein kinase